MQNDLDAAKDFWKDYVTKLTMGQSLPDPFMAGVKQGQKVHKDEESVIVIALERLVSDHAKPATAEVQQRAHKILKDLRGQK